MTKRTVISIIIMVSILLVSVWAFRTSTNITKNLVNVSNNPSNTDEKTNIEELIITETRNGEKFWEAYATAGQYDSKNNVANLLNVKGNFYKKNKVILSFEAPKAVFNQKTKAINLKGGTRLATDSKIYITSEELGWIGNTDLITAKGKVKISKNNEFLSTGDKSIFNTEFTKFKISGNSKTNVYKAN